MGGSNGTNAQNVINQKTQGQALTENANNAANSNSLAGLMSQYAGGNMSLQDALGQAQAIGGQSGAGGAQGALNALATSPVAGQQLASQQFSNDPTLGKYFQKGGLQDQAMGQSGALSSNLDQDRQALMGKGEQYGLTDQDLKAYGQASGNIARQFGQTGNALASQLASRGLSAGASGSAGAQFSGLMGSQNEQLAQLQNQISQNRINTAQGLAQFRSQADASRQAQNNSLLQGLGAQAQSGIQGIRSQNQQGAAQSTGAGLSNAQLQNSNLESQQNQLNNEFAQQQQTRKKSFGETMGDAATGAVAGGLSNAIGGVIDPIGTAQKLAPAAKSLSSLLAPAPTAGSGG